jgi:uncharacterized protein YegP (UPF0339 family)
MLAHFEYWKSTEGQWYFHLIAPNTGILSQSGGYDTKCECLEGIDLIRLYADVAAVQRRDTLDVTQDKQQSVWE